MPFTASAQGQSWCECRSPRRQDESWLLACLDASPVECLLEVGPGDGSRAAWLLRRFPGADYRAFEPSPALVSRSLAELATFAERASVERRNLALQLPAGTATQDAVLCLDLLEYLRMDELYMVLAESRRTLKPGGRCFLRSLSFGSGLRGRIAAGLRSLALRWRFSLFGGSRPLELNHYISPEDWRVLDDRKMPEGWLSRQTVALERIESPLA